MTMSDPRPKLLTFALEPAMPITAASFAPMAGRDALVPDALDEDAVTRVVLQALAPVARDAAAVTAESAAASALAALGPWLAQHDVLVVSVTRRGFGSPRAPIVTASDLAVALAAAGIQSIVFKRGLTEVVLAAWMAGLSGAARLGPEALAMRLWAVDTDAAGVRWRDASAFDFDDDAAAWTTVRGVDAFGLAEHADLVRAFDAGPAPGAAPPETDWRRLMTFTNAERERLRGARLDSPAAAACRYAQALVQRAETASEPAARDAAADGLAVFTSVLVQQRRFTWLRDILTRIHPTAADMDAAWLRPVLVRLCSEANVLVLGDVLDDRNSEASDVAAVRELLARLPRAVEPLAALLATAEPARSRRLVCLTLAAVAAHDPNLLVQTAVGQTWYVVRNIAFVLGRIGDASVIPHLNRWARHDDERVRVEVARALGRVRADGAADALCALLDDRDARVRQCAVWSLATLEDRAALPRLRQRLFEDKEFRDRPGEERDDFFRTYGRLADEATYAELQRVVSQRPRLGFGWGNELRRGACLALGETGRDDAAGVLQAQLKSRDSRLRDAAQTALATLAAGPRGTLLRDEDDWCEPARIGGEMSADRRFRLEADDA
jgi:HEAT repeat protein